MKRLLMASEGIIYYMSVDPSGIYYVSLAARSKALPLAASCLSPLASIQISAAV